MNTNIKALLATTILAISWATGAAPRPGRTRKRSSWSRLISLPMLAQADAEAMYLHDTNDGRTVLYIEAQNGQQLTALDVTDPSRIQRVAQTTIPANSAFDFVRSVGDEGAVIRYRDGSGVALLSFKHYKYPVLVNSSTLENANTSEDAGTDGFVGYIQ